MSLPRMHHLSILDRMTTPLDSDVRCTRCGCAIDPSAVTCAACGVHVASVAAPTSAGALGDQRYKPAPAPVAQYDIPLGATDSLGATFKLWTENLPRLAALGFIPYALLIPVVAFGAAMVLLPEMVGSTVLDGGLEQWWPLLAVGGAAFGALFLVVAFASIGACVHLVDEKTQGGDVTIGAAFLASLKHVGWLFVAYVGLSVLAMSGAAAPMVPLIFAIDEASWSIAALALPLSVVTAGAFVLCARLIPLLPVIIVEDTDAFTAVGRAWRLTSGRTVKVVSAALLFGLVYFGVAMAVGMIGIIPILGAFIQLFVNALLVPLCYVFLFVIYAGCVREEQDAGRA